MSDKSPLLKIVFNSGDLDNNMNSLTMVVTTLKHAGIFTDSVRTSGLLTVWCIS